MTNIVQLNPSSIRGLMIAKSGYDARLVEWYKEYPGSRYAPGYGAGTWLLPKELEPELRRIGKKWGIGVAGSGQGITAPRLINAGDAYPFQVEAAQKALSENSWMFNFQTGCGKTLAAILALRAASLQGKILIIRPALGFGVWEKQLDLWWPGHPEVGVLLPGKVNETVKDCPIIIVSYALAKKLPLAPYAAIVLDESAAIAHGGKNGAQRTRYCEELRKANPNSLRLCLSATPVMTRFEQIHAQLNWLWPTRFAHWLKFTDRYGIKEDTGYVGSSGQPAMRLVGLDPAHEAELQYRLSCCSSRMTKAEAAPWLPPFIASLLTVNRPRGFNPAELTERFLNTDQHNLDAMEFLKAHSVHKISVVAELATEALENETHICVLSHLRETARRIFDTLVSDGQPALLLDDSMDAKKRASVIDQARLMPACILVTTMHKVRESIDLTVFGIVYFAEMYPSPGIIDQTLGRFNRLNSTKPTTVYFVALAGSYEETVGAKLVSRAKEFKALYKPSKEMESTMEAFEDKRSDEAFRDHLFELCKGA